MNESKWGKLTYREVILINGVRSAIKRLDHGAPWAKESTSDFLKAVLEEAKVEKTLGEKEEKHNE